ncbi:MAG: C40 family peptidase [Treponemataceae bacterium]|nr:C40 family peptidase [Treponemataceae bacterium]
MTEAEARAYRERLVAEAKKYVGSPYVRGATGPDAFDCSGLIYFVARESIQYQLPRTAKAMYDFVTIVPNDKKEPGDLVFFRTTGDGSISHVGLYIGNSQFISAVSDGTNTGVIVSSLNEGYWKPRYAACGKFIRASGMNDAAVVASAGRGASDTASGVASRNSGASSASGNAGTPGGGFFNRLAFEGTLAGDWSLFTEKSFFINFRGLSTQGGIVYEGSRLSPGVGVMVRWNYGVGAFQIPLLLSLSFGEFIKTYAGPVFTMGACGLPASGERIKASVFPGIIGISVRTPSITKGRFKVSVIQDISYTVFNAEDGAALSPLKSAAAGLEFSTGISVRFPLSAFAGG